MKSGVRLYRVGSDPELLFCRVTEWTHTVVPATDVITANKALGLTTFIGLDGHAATAELRPSPAHNVWQHVHELAYAMARIEEYLRTNKKMKAKDVRMFAQPYIGSEPLGGHIHVSAFVEDADMKAAQDKNLTLNQHTGQWQAINGNVPAGSVSGLGSVLERLASRAANGEAMTSVNFGRTMDYLLLPFERWSQPWHGRLKRNSKYGANADTVRIASSPRPAMPKFTNHAYVHYEYRMPSTPLVHPMLTYAYLALAKLTLLNWEKLSEIALKHPTAPLPNSSEPDNQKSWQQFKDRLAGLEKTGLRITTDLKQLRPALTTIGDEREKWFNPFNPVNVEAWRKYSV